jgi:hypothetical protein
MKKNIYLVLFLIFLSASMQGQEQKFSDSLTVGDISIEGNIVTNKKVIFRELDFAINEIIPRGELEYRKQTSVNNLIKTSLFNFVDIYTEEIVPNIISIKVSLTERWYIWPNIFLNQTDTNFSEWWRTKDLDKLEYGIGLKINNFRGSGETLILNYHIGNFVKYELDYRGIYLDKAKRHSISFLATYSSQNILPWNIELNKEVLLKENHKLYKETDFSVKYRYRKGYFNSHMIELGYTDFQIADTIYSLNPYYAGFNNHGRRYFNLRYEFSIDTRDSRIYPKTGYFLLSGINKKGLGLLPGEYKAIDVYAQFCAYWRIHNRFYFASGLWYSSNNTKDYVFSLQPGLGYLQFVRGYEYYVVNGSNTFLFKNLVKYELLPMKIINLNIWPFRRLYQFNKIPFEIYTNIFIDVGYVSNKFEIYKSYSNSLANKLMYSTGAGVDFVTYYDKVLGLDYSFNALGERGLFIHWKAAIR